MVNITISIPDELREKMRKCKDANWSAICRQAIVEYVEHGEIKAFQEIRKTVNDFERDMNQRISDLEAQMKALFQLLASFKVDKTK